MQRRVAHGEHAAFADAEQIDLVDAVRVADELDAFVEVAVDVIVDGQPAVGARRDCPSRPHTGRRLARAGCARASDLPAGRPSCSGRRGRRRRAPATLTDVRRHGVVAIERRLVLRNTSFLGVVAISTSRSLTERSSSLPRTRRPRDIGELAGRFAQDRAGGGRASAVPRARQLRARALARRRALSQAARDSRLQARASSRRSSYTARAAARRPRCASECGASRSTLRRSRAPQPAVGRRARQSPLRFQELRRAVRLGQRRRWRCRPTSRSSSRQVLDRRAVRCVDVAQETLGRLAPRALHQSCHAARSRAHWARSFCAFSILRSSVHNVA